MGKSYFKGKFNFKNSYPIFVEQNEKDITCRQIFSAGRDGKIRMHEAQYHKLGD